VEPNRSCEAFSRSATREFLNTVRNPMVHYRVYKIAPLLPVKSQMNPIPAYLTKIHPKCCLSHKLDLPSRFPIKIMYTFLFSPIRTACPAHLILHNLAILITRIQGLEYKLWRSSLYSFSILLLLHLSLVQTLSSVHLITYYYIYSTSF
jgi:hypothetical protein